jgi:copper transporter 1
MPDMPDGGHGGHNVPSHNHGGDALTCSMSMVWNTATQGMCVVFPSWHVTGQHSFVMTLVALFIIAMMLERIRYQIRALDGKLIIQHKIDSGLLNAWGSPRDHRRKASVQQVLVGNGMSRSPLKSDGSLGGPALVSSMSVGDRRASPSHLNSDSASFGSRSDDDAPLLPSAYSRSHKRQITPMRGFMQTFMWVQPRMSHPSCQVLIIPPPHTAHICLSRVPVSYTG